MDDVRLKKRWPVFSTLFMGALLSIYAALAVSHEKTSLNSSPLDFVLPLPTIPSSISVGDNVTVTYTIMNEVGTAFLPIFTEVLDAAGSPVDTIVTRINIGSEGDCGVSGTLLGPSSQCTIELLIEPTFVGEEFFTLLIDYGGRDVLSSEISFNGITGFAYISNSGNNLVIVCKEDTAGILDDCTSSGQTFSGPRGVEIQKVDNINYAYVVNQDGNTVSQCTINPTTGLFTSCVDSGVEDIFNNPFGIAFQNTETNLYAYVVSLDDQQIFQCLVDSISGQFNNCDETTHSALYMPYGISIHTVNGQDYAYITSLETGSVTQCTVNDSSGNLRACGDSGVGEIFNTPENIAFFTSNADYAYITDPGEGIVWQCSINATTGAFVSCGNSGATGLSLPQGIAFATVNTVNYAYIANDANTRVTQCTVGGSGGLSGCANVSIGNGLTGPWGITFFTTTDNNNYAYVPNFTTGTVSQCKQNLTTGNLYCLDSGAGSAFTTPSEAVIQVVNGVTYLYVANFSALVSKCTLNTTTGALSACVSAGGTGYSVTSDLAFQTINGTLYAYVSEGINRVAICPVQLSGQFGSCFDSGVGAIFPAPRGLNFQTVNGVLYLYVTTPGNGTVTQCEVNTLTALLSNCLEAGSGYDSPFAVVFETFNDTLYVYLPGVGSSVFQCVVNTTSGLFSSCVNTPPVIAYSIAFSTVEGEVYGYIPDASSNNTIYQCLINPTTGGLETCPTAFAGTDNIAINASSGIDYAYVIVDGGVGIRKCPINASTGVITIASCVDSGAGFIFTNASDIVFPGISFGGSTFAYVTDSGSNHVYRCTLNTGTGALSACTDSGLGTIFDVPTNIAFDTVSGVIYAYIVNSDGDVVSQCTVNSSSGVFASCVDSTLPIFSQPVGIGFFNPLDSLQGYAYISDIDTNTVFRCEFDNNSGLLEACVDSGAGAVFDMPINFAFFTTNNIPYAYVTSPGDGNVYQCQVDADTGVFLNGCAASPDSFSEPWGIGFGIFDNIIYGYVADRATSTIYQCTFDLDTGELDNCVNSGAMLINLPENMVFF